jgi:hypothetical protein
MRSASLRPSLWQRHQGAARCRFAGRASATKEPRTPPMTRRFVNPSRVQTVLLLCVLVRDLLRLEPLRQPHDHPAALGLRQLD